LISVTNSEIYTSNQKSLNDVETNYILKKIDSNRLLQQLTIKQCLFIMSTINLVKSHFLKLEKLCDEQELNESSISSIDSHFFTFISKFALLNTNMNAYWKLSHLKYFLLNLLLKGGFGNFNELDDELEKPTEKPFAIINENPEIISKAKSRFLATRMFFNDALTTNNSTVTNSAAFNSGGPASSCSNNNQIEISINAIKEKRSKESNLSVDSLKLELNKSAVLSVSDSSANYFNIDEMSYTKKEECHVEKGNNGAFISTISNFNKSSFQQRKSKYSLKLLEECLEKLAKHDANVNSGLFSMFNLDIKHNRPCGVNFFKRLSLLNAKSLKNDIKLVTNAIIVLSSRELLLTFISLLLKRTRRLSLIEHSSSLNSLTREAKLAQLNCENEYELLQLFDVLYHTEALSYRQLLKNLVANFLKGDDDQLQSPETNHPDQQKQMSLLSKISILACEFMFPEFKLLTSTNWYSRDPDTYRDSHRYRISPSVESHHEESISFNTPNKYLTTSIKYGLNLKSKPNDIEKLVACNDTSLLVVFDKERTSPKEAITVSDTNRNILKLKMNDFLKPIFDFDSYYKQSVKSSSSKKQSKETSEAISRSSQCTKLLFQVVKDKRVKYNANMSEYCIDEDEYDVEDWGGDGGTSGTGGGANNDNDDRSNTNDSTISDEDNDNVINETFNPDDDDYDQEENSGGEEKNNSSEDSDYSSDEWLVNLTAIK
jgi:hypothetical protein